MSARLCASPTPSPETKSTSAFISSPLCRLYAAEPQGVSILDAGGAQHSLDRMGIPKMADLIFCAVGLGLFAAFGLYARLLGGI
jgi:hypothetical protein